VDNLANRYIVMQIERIVLEGGRHTECMAPHGPLQYSEALTTTQLRTRLELQYVK